MDNFNDPIIQELAKAYSNMIRESHTHEELIKLSDEELNGLVDEYTKKIGETEGEEKEHHEKELADINSIMASRKGGDKEEVMESNVITQLSKAYLNMLSQLSEMYHGTPSECMEQCKENYPDMSKEECKKKYCADDMCSQSD